MIDLNEFTYNSKVPGNMTLWESTWMKGNFVTSFKPYNVDKNLGYQICCPLLQYSFALFTFFVILDELLNRHMPKMRK